MSQSQTRKYRPLFAFHRDHLQSIANQLNSDNCVYVGPARDVEQGGSEMSYVPFIRNVCPRKSGQAISSGELIFTGNPCHRLYGELILVAEDVYRAATSGAFLQLPFRCLGIATRPPGATHRT